MHRPWAYNTYSMYMHVCMPAELTIIIHDDEEANFDMTSLAVSTFSELHWWYNQNGKSKEFCSGGGSGNTWAYPIAL